MNPKLQRCLENYTLEEVENNGDAIKSSITKASKLDISYLPDDLKTKFNESIGEANKGLEVLQTVKIAKNKLEDYTKGYQPLQHQVSIIQTNINKLKKLANEADGDEKETLTAKSTRLENSIPKEWKQKNKEYKALSTALKKVRRQYYSAVDSSYESLSELQLIIEDSTPLIAFNKELKTLEAVINNTDAKEAITKIKAVESTISDLKGTEKIKGKLAKARRTLKKAKPDEDINEVKSKALSFYQEAIKAYEAEILWREKATASLLPDLKAYDTSINTTIGLRLQERLTDVQAKGVASCLSVHRNISLEF
jgi:hypothetical protein